MATRGKIALFITASGAALAIGQSALAQSAKPTSIDEVVVTASRIARTGFTAPTPTTVLGLDTVQARAAVNVADVINEIPAFRPTQTPAATVVGATYGANFLDLRGLGTQRTLVLVDGRRHVPSTTQAQVDLNMIPSSLIERTEVVTGGASAAWGSDAVAGVVNLILKDKLQGLQGNISYGQTDKGDGKDTTISLAGGTGFMGGRGHVIAGLEYDDNQGGDLYDTARDWTRKRYGLVTLPATRAAGLPSRIISSDVHFSNQLAPAGVIPTGPLANTTFLPDGSPTPFRLGSLVAGNMMVGGENENSTLYTGSYLVNPVKRVVGLSRATFDLTSNLSAFAEFSYGDTSQDTFSANRRNQANLTIQIDNAFMSPILRQRMVAAGVTSVPFGRVESEIGNYPVHNERKTRRGVFGFKGDLGHGWTWDSYYQYGVSQSFSQTINSVNSNMFAAIDAVAGPNGTIICRASTVATQRADAGCVPYNVFGVGAPSKAAQDYVTEAQWTHTFTREQSGAVNVRGEPLSIWAGPVSLAMGAEWRRESANVKSDPYSQASRFEFGNTQPIHGGFNVAEVYAETVVPLAKDAGFIHSLDLNAAVRRTDYSLAGLVTTWKTGLTFEDSTRQLRLRATKSRDIRAPNINELFAARTSSFANVRDPSTGISLLIPVLTSGNVNLAPEEADTLTYGAVISPRFIPGLRFSADYFDIDITGVISSLTGQQIVDRCAAGAADLCALVTRANGSTGTLVQVLAQQLNLNRLKTSGWDFEAGYRAPIDRLGVPGSLDLRALATKVEHLTTIDSGGPVDRGRQTVPRWSANYSATYSLKRFTGNLTARMVGSRIFDATLIGPDNPAYNPALSNSINDNTMPAVWYFNASAQYKLVDRGGRSLVLYGVLNNITDKDPPPFGGTNATAGTVYDLLGRFGRIGMRFTY